MDLEDVAETTLSERAYPGFCHITFTLLYVQSKIIA